MFRLEKPVQLTPGGKPRSKAASKKANGLWQKVAAWEDVDWGRSQIRLWTRKRRSRELEGDWIPLTSELKDELAFWREKCPVRSPFVFVCLQVSGDTYALPFRAKLNCIRALCKRARVAPPFSYHALRHHVASHLASRGVPMLFISKILRHSNVSMTEKYLHDMGEGMHEAASHLAFGTSAVPLTQKSGQGTASARPREISGSGARIRT